MKRSESFASFAKSFAQFQAEVTNPKMTANNPHVGSKYAPLSEVFNAVRPVMAKHGLSFYQDVATNEENVIVTTTLFHESGEWLESSPLSVPAGQKLKDGSIKINAQTIGAATTYGKRYQLQACIGVAADEDADGEDLKQPLHVPTNLVSSPNEATLKAKYQLATGKLEGFEQYVQEQREKGNDNKYILAALDKAIQSKKTAS